MMTDKYVLRMNQKQLEAVSFSLEVVARLLSGQLNEIHHMFATRDTDANTVRRCINELKAALFKDLDVNANYGIYQEELSYLAKVNFDMYTIIRSFLDGSHLLDHLPRASREPDVELSTE